MIKIRLFSIILIIFLLYIGYYHWRLEYAKDVVMIHLKEQGYNEEDVLTMEPYYDLKSEDLMFPNVKVYFADEPHADYTYSHTDSPNIYTQTSWYSDGKHQER